jgi:dTDP-4-dehydrorhamnose 3,5-epimerase
VSRVADPNVTVESTHLNGLVLLRSRTIEDHRGFFQEIFRADRFRELGLPDRFLQENQSRSKRGVLRGLHFQWDRPMGKLMRVLQGRAFLVAVDIRPGSPTLGNWFGRDVAAEDRLLVWGGPGFARGFCALSEEAEIEYKCTELYNPAGEGAVRWDDPEIGIAWPTKGPVLSPKDAAAGSLASWLGRPESRVFAYP